MTEVANTNVTATDLMQHDVICVRRDDTLQIALDLMTENHVTGLAVMDERDRCIGVISATDILNVEQTAVDDDPHYGWFFDPDSRRWEEFDSLIFSHERLTEISVGEVMSSDVIAAFPDEPLQALCRKMNKNGVHRLLVLDDNQKLYGIVTSTDIVGWIAESDRQGD